MISFPINKEIFLVEGADFSSIWKTRAPRSLERFDLTGYSFVGSFKRSLSSPDSYAIDVSAENASEGEVSVNISGERTVGLRPGRYAFDVLAYGVEKPNIVLFSGLIHLEASVTPRPVDVIG